MESRDADGVGRVKKPTGFLTNSAFIKNKLSNKLEGTAMSIWSVGEQALVRSIQPNCATPSFKESDRNWSTLVLLRLSPRTCCTFPPMITM